MAVGKNVIYLAPAKDVCPQQEEATIAAAQTVLPGSIVIKDSAGDFISHNVADAGGDWFVANLDAPGQGDVSTAWTVGDTAQAFIPEPGQFYNVVVAASQNITAKGTALSSNGDGSLKIATTTGATPDVVLFYADEVINTGGTAQLVKARVALSSPAPSA